MTTHNYTVTSHDRPIADLVRLLGHPDDVLNHPELTRTEKREILAAWASDAHAVVDAPSRRQLDSGSVVDVDDILRALRQLDVSNAGEMSTRSSTSRSQPRRSWMRSKLPVVLRRKDDDDDDPPPSPIAALPPSVAYARRRRWELNDQEELVAA